MRRGEGRGNGAGKICRPRGRKEKVVGAGRDFGGKKRMEGKRKTTGLGLGDKGKENYGLWDEYSV